NNMSSNERQRIHDSLLNRLESPDRLAIQKSGSQIILASSKSSQVTFQADGQERTEQLNDGRQVRVRTELSGDVLRINTNGDSGNNFTATIEPVDQGRRLRVRRSVNVENLNQTVTVQSYYDRTSDIAQLNIYDGANQNPISSTGNNPTEFLVPNGTQLVAILRNQLTSKNSQEGDRFTMEVRTPSEYNGAVIEGNVTNKSQAGRVTGKSQLGLNFERIRMPDGRTYKFAGLIDNIRTPEGQDIKVDNEGQAQSGSQTTKTATRGAVGAGLGALIGAIAGGGKGAAIGAVIGAGAGAGTAIIPGGEDLKLASGAEFTMRASAPQRN
ncbi:MAG: hypothetical protein ACRD4L_06025, partial [Pyrinomonadaceae bacterium]